MNTTTISAALVLLLAASTANATHGTDGDALPEGVEHAVCAPMLGGQINTLGVLGSCNTMNGDWDFRAGNDPAPCGACSNATILYRQDLPITTGSPIGPFSTPSAVNVTYFETYYKVVGGAQLYCFFLNGVPEVCVNLGTSSVPTVPRTYLVNATAGPFNVPATSFDVHLQYRWIEANLTACCSVGSDTVWYPVDPFDPAAVSWWAANGNQTSLDLYIEPRLDGDLIGTPAQVSIPYLGQQLAAAVMSSPSNPFPL